jgi:hypothetical protein
MNKRICSLALALCLLSAIVPYGNATDPDPLDLASDWAVPHIIAALDKGFVPDEIQDDYTKIITRSEFCRMAVKWVEYATEKSIDTLLAEQGKSRSPNPFNDTSDPDILAAFALGITAGTSTNTFSPSDRFTRQQAAVMIMNTCRAIGARVSNPPASGFADFNTAAEWARPGINFVRANSIMQGVGDNRFDPGATYTREQSIVTFNNIKPDELPSSTFTVSLNQNHYHFDSDVDGRYNFPIAHMIGKDSILRITYTSDVNYSPAIIIKSPPSYWMQYQIKDGEPCWIYEADEDGFSVDNRYTIVFPVSLFEKDFPNALCAIAGRACTPPDGVTDPCCAATTDERGVIVTNWEHTFVIESFTIENARFD